MTDVAGVVGDGSSSSGGSGRSSSPLFPSTPLGIPHTNFANAVVATAQGSGRYAWAETAGLQQQQQLQQAGTRAQTAPARPRLWSEEAVGPRGDSPRSPSYSSAGSPPPQPGAPPAAGGAGSSRRDGGVVMEPSPDSASSAPPFSSPRLARKWLDSQQHGGSSHDSSTERGAVHYRPPLPVPSPSGLDVAMHSYVEEDHQSMASDPDGGW